MKQKFQSPYTNTNGKALTQVNKFGYSADAKCIEEIKSKRGKTKKKKALFLH